MGSTMENQHTCPNCDIPLEYEYKEHRTDGDERIWSPYYDCRICSYGYFVFWDYENW